MKVTEEEKWMIHNEIKNRSDGGRFWLPEGEEGIPLTNNEYGMRLRDLRIVRGVSQSRMAKAIGKNQQYYNLIEHGKKKRLVVSEIPAFANVLGCTACYLAGYSDELNGIKGGLTLPILKSSDGEIVDMAALLQGYRRDPELTRLCIDLLKGSLEQRKFYKRKLEELISKNQTVC